jgi:exoribonuclease-2
VRRDPVLEAYHLQRFLLEHFPQGSEVPPGQDVIEPAELPMAPVPAFSIDDATTTEIDDAFSVRPRAAGGWEIGVHIAAPALAIAPGSPLDTSASARLSTVYMPGAKITMLPEAVIERYTLSEQRIVPTVSLYLELGPDLRLLGTRSAVEKVHVAANLRHDAPRSSQRGVPAAGGRIFLRRGPEAALDWPACWRPAAAGRTTSARSTWTTASTWRTTACASCSASAVSLSTRWCLS